jgi:hypothetical protein
MPRSWRNSRIDVITTALNARLLQLPKLCNRHGRTFDSVRTEVVSGDRPSILHLGRGCHEAPVFRATWRPSIQTPKSERGLMSSQLGDKEVLIPVARSAKQLAGSLHHEMQRWSSERSLHCTTAHVTTDRHAAGRRCRPLRRLKANRFMTRRRGNARPRGNRHLYIVALALHKCRRGRRQTLSHINSFGGNE